MLRTPSPSLVERFGLLTIIVLGEVVVGVVAGVSFQHPITWLVGFTGAMGTAIAIGRWWVDFDFVSHRIPKPDWGSIGSWYYLHLPLTMGITAIGAAVVNITRHIPEPIPREVRWLLVTTIAVVLVCTAFLTHSVRMECAYQTTHRIGRRVMLHSATLIILTGLTPLATLPLFILVIFRLLAPVYFALRTWVAVQASRSI